MDSNSEFIQSQIKQGEKAIYDRKRQILISRILFFSILGSLMVGVFIIIWLASNHHATRADRFLIDAKAAMPSECEIAPIRNTFSYVVTCNGEFKQLVR